MIVAPTLRVLVLGLGNPDQGNDGIGGRLVRSLRTSFDDVEVRLASEFSGFSEILDDYDLVIVMRSLSYSGNVGLISLGSPYALEDARGTAPGEAEPLAKAIAYARLMGHTLPRIEVINVCVGTEEWPERALSPAVASVYPDIVSRVRSLVKHIIREASHPVGPFGR
jgi:hydrogenase maturation protease